MSPELLLLAKSYFEPHEGRKNFPYLCIHGIITFGVGHAAPKAAMMRAAKWYRNGVLASMAEVDAAWAKVKMQPFGRNLTAESYQHLTSIRLPDSEIDRIFSEDLAEAERLLRHAFIEYNRWPIKIQLAMIDMMFSVGPAFLGNVPPKAYPRLVAAARRQDWATCAAECKRGGVSPTRDAALAALFSSTIPSKKAQ